MDTNGDRPRRTLEEWMDSLFGPWALMSLWAFVITAYSVHYVLNLAWENGHWLFVSLTCASFAVVFLGILFHHCLISMGRGPRY